MTGRYPPIEPFRRGTLDVGDGHRMYWESCGAPSGKPAVVLYGGPGSGCSMWQRRLFDPAAYRVVLFDQRGCGRSMPRASEPGADLSTNTTAHLLDDIERLRSHLGVDRWLVLGGSWGSLLALAYAERHPERVSELVVFGVATGRRSETDWLFRGGVGAFFPRHWERLVEAVPPDRRRDDIVETYADLLFDPDPHVRDRAAFEWCLWESATPSWPPTEGLDDRFGDPAFALGFARLVTHYVRHDHWVEDGVLLRDAASLIHLPGTIVNGRYDFQSPLGNAWVLHRAWPAAELVVAGDAGHDASAPAITDAIVAATDAFGRH
jgi:proline iminopeptidase